MTEIAQTTKRTVEVFHDQEYGFVTEAADDFAQDQLRRIVPGERPRLVPVVSTEFVWILAGQFVGDFQGEIDQAGEDVVFAKPGNSHLLAQLRVPAQAVVHHRYKMRFSTAARSDEKQMMLVASQHAFFTPTDHSAQQLMTLNKDAFSCLSVGVARRVRRDRPLVDHPFSPSPRIHHF